MGETNNTNNSISTVLPKFSRLLNNAVEGYNKMTQAIISNTKEVFVEFEDAEGNIKRLSVPGLKHIASEIERLDNNVQKLLGLTSAETTVKIDNTFRTVMLSEYGKETPDIGTINNVTEFQSASNFFFESLMNPSLSVTLDLTAYVQKNIENILVERYILKDLSDEDVDWFETTYKDRNDINREEFLEALSLRSIAVISDNDVVTLPPKQIIYSGDFDVLVIDEIEEEVIVGDTTISRKRKRYQLNKLTYTDVRHNFEDNLSLKIGDVLVLNDNTTAYKITAIDASSNSVILELRDGYSPILIASNSLKFYSDENIITNAEIKIGFNEYDVVFIKGISGDLKIPSKSWSPGLSFFSNELKIVYNEIEQTLEQFYRSEVVDVGTYLLGISKEQLAPAYLGVQPDAPALADSDFQVVQINKQINENRTIDELKNMEAEKTRLQAEISELTKALTIEPTNTNLINDKNSKVELYNSLVREIENKSVTTNLSNLSPKYRVRGFFSIPNYKETELTGEQKIVQFEIAHRYISSNGNSNTIDQIKFNDNGLDRFGTYTDWIESNGKLLPRLYNPETSKLEWVDQNVEDSSITNINSVGIAIRPNEKVEIKVRSVSEAGYPASSLKSDWSNIIRTTFPENLDGDDVVIDIVENNKKDLVRVNLQNELTSVGVYTHVANSFIQNEKFFAHPATEVSSGFLTPEQNQISLFDQLISFNNYIREIQERLDKQTPVLNIKLIDSDGNEFSIRKDQQNKIFAGYYTDFVEDLNVKKGKIITKTYFLILENATASDLELISRVPGSIDRRVITSVKPDDPDIDISDNMYYSNYDTFESADTDYNTMRRYDLVPILLSNPNDVDGEISNNFPLQSSQVKSQFVYNRFKDIAKEESFYSYYIPDSDGNNTGNQITSIGDSENVYGRTGDANAGTGFLWGGNFDTSGDPYLTDSYHFDDNVIEVHTNHPYVKSEQAFISAYQTVTGKTSSNNYLTEAQELFKHSKFMYLKSDSELGKKQTIYIYDDTEDRTVKISFGESDEYLLGKQSCGAYLFMSPDVHDTIAVEGKSLLSKRTITFGEENRIQIPILFQFRMTDYYGEDINGLGNIGGDSNGLTTNITYSKEIGFDIYDSNDNLFSFDLEISAKYAPDNLNIDKVPTKKIGIALDDISRNLKNSVIRSNIND